MTVGVEISTVGANVGSGASNSALCFAIRLMKQETQSAEQTEK